MATAMHRQLSYLISELRYQPTPKRVRVLLSGDPVVDTTRAWLVWEPKRVVPSYAVPETDLVGRGRDRPCGRPPAQIPACGTTALGSCLRF